MYDQIRQIIASSFQVKEDDLAPEATLAALGLDSLDLVELSLSIRQLGVRVTDDELNELQRLDAIAQLVADRGATVPQ